MWRQLKLAGELERERKKSPTKSYLCEQMVTGECMFRDSDDARKRTSVNNSISSSITLFTISMILSHKY